MIETEPGHRDGPFSAGSSPARARVRNAAIELVVSAEAPRVRTDELCEAARVTAEWFENEFGTIDVCFERIYLANVAEFDRVVFSAAPARARWRERLRETAYAAARYVERRPLETRFDMIHMLAGSERAMAERDRYVGRIVDLIDDGRLELEDPESIGRSVAEATFGSIYLALTKQLAQGDGVGILDEVVPELMCLAVRPYLGAEAAMEELAIPPPPRANA